MPRLSADNPSKLKSARQWRRQTINQSPNPNPNLNPNIGGGSEWQCHSGVFNQDAIEALHATRRLCLLGLQHVMLRWSWSFGLTHH